MTVLAILEGLGIFLVLPIIIGLIIISLVMVYEQTKRKMTGNIMASIESLVCSIDADCPEGYVCVNGKCLPQNNMSDSMSPAS